MLCRHIRPGIEKDLPALLANLVQPSFLYSSFVTLDQLVEETPIVENVLASLSCFLADFRWRWGRGRSGEIGTDSVEDTLLVAVVDRCTARQLLENSRIEASHGGG